MTEQLLSSRMAMAKTLRVPIILALIGLVIIPSLYAMGYLSIETVSRLGRYMTYAILAVGLDLLWGYVGILGLCQATFFCLGTYAMGMYLAHHGGPEGIVDANGWKLPACLFVPWAHPGTAERRRRRCACRVERARATLPKLSRGLSQITSSVEAEGECSPSTRFPGRARLRGLLPPLPPRPLRGPPCPVFPAIVAHARETVALDAGLRRLLPLSRSAGRGSTPSGGARSRSSVRKRCRGR